MTEPGEGDERIIDGELHWLRDGVWLKERERPRWRYFARCPHDCGWWAELGVDGARAAAMVHICRAKACPGGCGRTHDECWAQARVLVEWEDAIFGGDAASAIEHGLRAIAGWPMPLVAVSGGVMRLDDAAKLRTVLGQEQLVRVAKWEDLAPLLAESHAASAIEQGLRAIAGWAYSERRAFNEALAYWLDYPGPVYGAELTEVVGHPDEFANCDCPSHAGEDGEVVVRPSARTTCYFCARPVSDGVCTVCGERQP